MKATDEYLDPARPVIVRGEHFNWPTKRRCRADISFGWVARVGWSTIESAGVRQWSGWTLPRIWPGSEPRNCGTCWWLQGGGQRQDHLDLRDIQ